MTAAAAATLTKDAAMRRDRPVVILGANEDEHVQVVRRALLERDAPVVVIDFSKEFTTVDLQEGETLNGIPLNLGGIAVCWNRYKRAEVPATHSDRVRQEYVAAVEWLGLHQNLAQLLTMRAVPFVNNLEATQFFGSKFTQLMAARALGLTVPSTLVSNDRRDLIRFLSVHAQAIMKPIKIRRILNTEDHDRSLFFLTKTLTLEEVQESADDAIFAIPLLVQERIEKQHEYRVVVVGDELFCFRIDSQARPETALDWRLGEHLPIYELIEPPDDVRAACKALQSKLGLVTGVYDFARNREGDLVFFECNPAGQWLQPALRCGAEIGHAFAKLLIDTARAS